MAKSQNPRGARPPVAQGTPNFSPRVYMRAYAGLELVEGTRRDLTHAARLIANYPLPVVLDHLARVSFVLEEPGTRYDRVRQIRLIEASCSSELRDSIRSRAQQLNGSPPMVLFHGAQVLITARLALLHCSDRESTETVAALDDLVRAMLTINDNLDDARRPAEDETEWFIRTLIRSMVFEHDGNWRTEAARWEELVHRLNEQQKETSGWVDYDAEFRSATGCELDQYRAMVMGFLAAHEQIRSADASGPQVDLNLQHLFANYTLPPGLIATICQDAAETAREFKEAPFDKIPPYYFVPFFNHPVARVGDLSWILSKRLLMNKLGSGIYHVVFTHLLQKWSAEVHDGNREKYVRNKVKEFRGCLGRVFQVYVRDLLNRASRNGAGFRVHDLDAVTVRSGQRRCDFVLVEGPSAILLECKSRFLTLQTAATGDFRSTAKDYRRLVLDAARQIDRTALDLELGTLRLDGVRPWDIRSYLPLIVTLGYVPVEYATYGWLEKEVERDRLSQHSTAEAESGILRRRVAPLQVIDVGSMERLEPILPTTLMAQLLIKKNADLNTRTSAFQNYMNWSGLPSVSNAYLDRVADDMANRQVEFWSRCLRG